MPGVTTLVDVAGRVRALADLPRVVAHKLMWAASPGLTVTLAVMVVAGAAFGPLYAVATGALVGAVATGGDVALPLVAIGALYAMQQVLAPAREAVLAALASRIDDQVRSRMMQAMLTPNGIAHLEDPSLQDDLGLARGIAWGMTPGVTAQGLAMLWLARLSALGSLALVAAFRWWLAVLLLAASVVTLRSKKKSFLNMTTLYSRSAEKLRRSSYFREVALGRDAAKETRVFGLGPWAVGRFDAAWLETMTEVWRERKRGGLVVLAGLSVKGGMTLVAFLYAARAGLDGDLSLQRFVVVMQALIGTASLSMVLGNPELMVEQGAAAIGPALAVERAVAAHAANLIMGGGDAGCLPRHAIVFDSVSFGYPGRDEPVFADLDLEIPAGRSLAIVGDNGSGKTTIVKLVARLYDPDGGRITVDGIPLTDLDPEQWHRRHAAIFQDFGRYALTARENVALASFGEDIDADALDRVAERAGIDDLVAGWDHGWDSVLNRQFDKGVEVSGGQWQRIALARALFAVETGAQVLVLDEPTAQLDVRSEAELYDRFLDLTRGLTTIVISHRFSTVRRADRIVVIDQGRVCESGSHDDLVELDGRYAAMFKLQAARFSG